MVASIADHLAEDLEKFGLTNMNESSRNIPNNEYGSFFMISPCYMAHLGLQDKLKSYPSFTRYVKLNTKSRQHE